MNSSNSGPSADHLNTWLQLVAFFVPIVGLALYVAYKPDKPESAKTALQLAGGGFLLMAMGIFIKVMGG